MIGLAREELPKAGELDNTLIVATGDNGAPGIPHGNVRRTDSRFEYAEEPRFAGGGFSDSEQGELVTGVA